MSSPEQEAPSSRPDEYLKDLPAFRVSSLQVNRETFRHTEPGAGSPDSTADVRWTITAIPIPTGQHLVLMGELEARGEDSVAACVAAAHLTFLDRGSAPSDQAVCQRYADWSTDLLYDFTASRARGLASGAPKPLVIPRHTPPHAFEFVDPSRVEAQLVRADAPTEPPGSSRE